MIKTARSLANLRKGLAENCILAVLRHGPTYGLALTRQLQDDGLVAGPSSLYPMLSRLQEAGLITSNWATSESERARKYYELTADGHAALRGFHMTWVDLRDSVDRILGDES